jgi:hypothetical protein
MPLLLCARSHVRTKTLNELDFYSLIKRFFSSKVTYIELDFSQILAISYCEVKPVGVAASIAVNPHEKVELSRSPLDGCIKVASFKVRVEPEEAVGSLGVERQSAAGGEVLVEVLVRWVGVVVAVPLVDHEGVALART